MGFHVGTDVGGTFTDLWAIAPDGRQVVVKSPSTPDIISGVLAAVETAASRFGLDVEQFCSGIDHFGHGTTAGLNALLTGRAASTAIVTTLGFRDTLEIGRLKRQVAGLTDLEIGDYLNRGRHGPIVPRRLVFEVDERVDRDGVVVRPLDIASARRVVEQIRASGVHAVAICTLWSVLNPSHEIALGDLVAASDPTLFVSLSHQVAPGIGEYARMSTTAVNAALGPVMGSYLVALSGALEVRGLRVPVQVMTGAGGVVSAADVEVEPVAALLSGPAAGVIACQQVGRRLGISHLLSVDVGGTSFDVATIVDSAPSMRSRTGVGGADIHRPSIDVGTIGAGGGSIARLDHGELLVGPQSAGSTPGPVCYGRGGTAVTVTDADLVLGVLDEDGFAGSGMRLDRRAAEEAIGRQIAQPLGLSVGEAAWGIRRVIDAKMADLLRSVTVERGYDPRDFVLFANGGQGPSHAWALCAELGVTRFVVTPTATAQSALGTGTCDLRQSAERPVYLRLQPGRTVDSAVLGRLSAALAETTDVACGRLPKRPDAPAPVVEHTVALRYRGQAHHLDVAVPAVPIDDAAFGRVLERFESDYEALFGKGAGFRQAGFEVLSLRCIATLATTLATRPEPRDPLRPVGRRPVVFDDPDVAFDCPVYATEFPAPGQHLDGPALVVYPGQTLVVPPGATATTDDAGNVHVELTDATASGGRR